MNTLQMFSALTAHAWAYPLLEVVHLLGVALLLGNLLLLESRVFGLGAELSLPALARLSLTLVAIGFGLALFTGIVMFATQADDLLANRAFTLKMGLLMLAGCNAGWFHARGSLQRVDALARVSMVLSTLLWVGVLACGRWIAYA